MPRLQHGRNFTSGMYYGCWERLGHFLYDPTGKPVSATELDLPWGPEELDGRLCPGWSRSKQLSLQNEGEALMHYRDGWTALAFWDRSIDKRYNSNSVFLFPGTLTFDQAVDTARKTFPVIWDRFAFQVFRTLVTGSQQSALR